MKVVVASAIISVATVVSAVMMSGNIDFKKQNVVKTDSGHVNLGEVYSEQGVVDVELRFIDDKSQVFSLKNLPRGSYQSSIDEKIQSLLDEYNKGKAEDKQITKDSLTFKVPYSLTLQSHTMYMTENIPSYDLILDKKTINFDKDTVVYKSISDATNQFMKDNDKSYAATYFIKEH